MSIEVMTAVWKHSEQTGGKLLVLLALADHANDDGYCWPKTATLATKARISERQLSRVLSELAETGELIVPAGPRSEDRPYQIRQYVVTTPMSDQDQTSMSDSARARADAVESSIEPSSVGDGQLFDAPDQVKLVWEHYQATVAGAKRRKLDSTRKACIKRALTVRSLDECREAIDGLARSPHHNGQNDSKQTYLDIQYALGQKSDSPDERIDKAIGWARKFSGAVQAVTNLSDGVATLRDVISAVPSQNSLLRDVVRTRLDTAVRQFERDGIIADGVLWELREHVPNVEPVIEDSKLIGWRKVTA